MQQSDKQDKIRATLRQKVIQNISVWTILILIFSFIFGVILSLQYYRSLNGRALETMLDQVEPYLARAAWQVNAPAVEFSLEALLGNYEIIRASFSEPFISVTVFAPGYENSKCYRQTIRENIGQNVEGVEINNASLTLCHKPVEFSQLASFVARLTLPFAFAGLLIIIAAYWMVDRVVIQPIAKISRALQNGSGFMAFELDGRKGYDDLDLLVDEIKSLTKKLMAERDIVSTWFYNSGDGLIVVDGNNNVERYNRVARRAFAKLGEPGLKLEDVFGNEVGFDIGESQSKRLQRDDGRVYNIRYSSLGSVDGDARGLYTIQDVTVQDIIANKKAQRDKLSAVGSIAVGIAHDLNNLLAVIQSTVEAMRGDANTTASHQKFLDDIEMAIDSGSSLTNQFTTFARKSDMNGQVVDIADIVDRTISLYSYGISQSPIRANIKDNGQIFVEPNMLVNSLLNLLKNACDASLQHEEITIETNRVSNNGRSFLSIEVRDNGVGIPPQFLDRVTDPFFTTKPQRKGTGLGLTSVKHFVEDWGGSLEITSNPPNGTTVRLVFSEHRETHDKRHTIDERPRKTGSKDILVVEDNVALLRGMVLGLRSMGHRVDSAMDCTSAMDFLNTDSDWDAVICDVNLPDGHGSRIFEAFRQSGKHAVFILVSGAFTREDVDAMNQIGTHYRLSKPFRNSEFSTLFNQIWPQ